MSTSTAPLDHGRLEEFLGQAVSEMAAAEAAATAYVGDRLGLYRAMADSRPVTADALAERTGTQPRLLREWLDTQVAGGWIVHDADTGSYTLPPEHAAVVADEDSPNFIGGIFEVAAAVWAGADRVADALRTDGAVGWGEHDGRLFRGVERLFAPIYRSQLTTEWIPALNGMADRLAAGARVADVGCGHGVSTTVMAQAYPESVFHGYDAHDASIEAARKRAAELGVSDRVTFQTASSTDFPGDDYDLICFFDCLHDMGDPVGAARRAGEALAPDGAVLLVEPAAGDDLDSNRKPVSRLYYAGSVFLCTPSSLSQDVGLGLGAQAGPRRLQQVFHEAGFRSFSEATSTPFNLVFEARV